MQTIGAAERHCVLQAPLCFPGPSCSSPIFRPSFRTAPGGIYAMRFQVRDMLTCGDRSSSSLTSRVASLLLLLGARHIWSWARSQPARQTRG
eukprot:7511095-Pyramimonas_sp.AAC.1